MTDDVVVRVTGLSKRFKLYSSARARLADWLRIPPSPRYKEFWALRDLSWELRRGECLGIIGPNGAGKSTLLKLLTGALYPTRGSLDVRGRVLSLLELGTGFNTDLTGRENVELSATLLGFGPGYAIDHVEEIEAFAELGDYFDRPVKFYSTGMLVRLAFSLFSTMEPDVFLVDEALAVGDLRFAGKALRRVRAMLDAGTTLLFVSHDLHLINRMCTRVLWLHAGTLQMDGDPQEVTRAYQQFVVHGGVQAVPIEPPEVIEPEPVGSVESAPIFLSGSWCDLEAYGGDVFRWADGDAEIIMPPSEGSGRELLLDIEPGPGAGPLPARIDVTDAHDTPLGVLELAGRQIVGLALTRDPGRIVLRVRAIGAEAPGDERRLLFRVFGWAWSDNPTLQPIQLAGVWDESARDLDLAYELHSMAEAVRRCAPVPAGGARITRVTTRSTSGEESVRFSTHDRMTLEIAVEATAEVRGLIVGMQLRDAFDRMITGTRTDWQRATLPVLRAGDRISVQFSCADLILGPGLYQFSIAVAREGREDFVSHWVDGAWRFEIVSSGEATVAGLVDMRWRYEPASTSHKHHDPADLLSLRTS